MKPIHFGGCSFSTLRWNPERRKHVSQGCSESASRGALVGAHVLRPFALACFAPCSNSQYMYSFRAVYASPAVLHPAFLSTPFGS